MDTERSAIHWTVVGTAVYIAIAVPRYTHFETVLENFTN